MSDALVKIESPTGARVTVTESDYKHKKLGGLNGKTYEDAGYKVVSYEDGTPYGEDAKPTAYALVDNSVPIGEGDGHTNLDGGKLTPQQMADNGLKVPEKAERASRAARTPEQPVASAQS